MFNAGTLRVDLIREALDYGGVRLRAFADVGGARVPVATDVESGDALEPGAELLDYPTFLDQPAPKLSLFVRNGAMAGIKDPGDYSIRVQQHARLLNDLISGVRLDVTEGSVSLASSERPDSRLVMSSYEPGLEAGRREKEFTLAADSILPPFGVEGFDGAGASLMALSQGLKDITEEMPSLLHYFVKPLRLTHKRRDPRRSRRVGRVKGDGGNGGALAWSPIGWPYFSWLHAANAAPRS
ncbi:MAG: hypothetical protein ACKVOP_00165 [Sphingomonadaceae bacterium]